MQIQTITLNYAPISAIDMHGKPMETFAPFAVRCPKFIELADGTVLYYFQAKYQSDGDEAPHCMVQMRSRDGGIDGFWGKRVALMLYASTDGGRTYREIKQICGKDELAAYSSLFVTGGGKLLCGWESGYGADLYRDIKCAVFDMAELAQLCAQ